MKSCILDIYCHLLAVVVLRWDIVFEHCLLPIVMRLGLNRVTYWLHYPPMHSGMKLLITPLLSGLLENDFNRMTEFDDFFKEIEKINRKKVMTHHHWFYAMYACLVLYGYMHNIICTMAFWNGRKWMFSVEQYLVWHCVLTLRFAYGCNNGNRVLPYGGKLSYGASFTVLL